MRLNGGTQSILEDLEGQASRSVAQAYRLARVGMKREFTEERSKPTRIYGGASRMVIYTCAEIMQDGTRRVLPLMFPMAMTVKLLVPGCLPAPPYAATHFHMSNSTVNY